MPEYIDGSADGPLNGSSARIVITGNKRIQFLCYPGKVFRVIDTERQRALQVQISFQLGRDLQPVQQKSQTAVEPDVYWCPRVNVVSHDVPLSFFEQFA